MGKNLIICVILFELLGCAPKQQSINSNNSDIVIRYVDPGSTSIYRISCEMFDSVFTPEIKELIIKKSSNDFILMDSLLKQFMDDTSINNIDVRVKILSNAKNDSIICMDGIGHFFSVSKNKCMKNEPLKDFILKAIYSKQ